MKSLQVRQLNSKMKSFTPLHEHFPPHSGWIRAIRKALGISLQQLGHKLSISKQSALDIERREQAGTITLKALREAAKALDMQLVYGFVPNDGSLEALIDRKAREMAVQIVMRTSQSMLLEDQQNSPQHIEQAIAERAAALAEEMPKFLWD